MQVECCDTIKIQVTAAIHDALCPLFTPEAQNVTDALYGSRKTRFGNAPDDEQRAFMDGLVGRYQAQGSPIKMIGMWGAIKAYGACDERCGIDLYDAMAIHRLECVAKDVKRFYPLGMDVTIISEDVTEAVLGSSGDKLNSRIERYQNALIEYAERNTESVRIVTESQLIEGKGHTTSDFLALGETLSTHLNAYWLASSQIAYTEWENLAEYKALQAVGWSGVIPTEMREHYLNRCGSEYPNMDNEGRVKMVCRYFGNALARYKMGLIQSGVTDASGMLPAIKSGFGTLGPGVSKAMLKGRVDYKIKASKNSRNSTPPWCGWGMLTEKFEPTIVGVRHGVPTAAHEVNVTSNGVCFRSDVAMAA
jgi:hypothetical protein